MENAQLIEKLSKMFDDIPGSGLAVLEGLVKAAGASDAQAESVGGAGMMLYVLTQGPAHGVSVTIIGDVDGAYTFLIGGKQPKKWFDRVSQMAHGMISGLVDALRKQS